MSRFRILCSLVSIIRFEFIKFLYIQINKSENIYFDLSVVVKNVTL
jgi:hypothetical protein